MAQLTVREASETYQSAMRNVLPVAPGVCATCHTFVDAEAGWTQCMRCSQNWVGGLDVVAPITYSVNLSQMHLALRNYKDGYYPQERSYLQARIAAVLWRFLERHEPCIAAALGVERFDVVTVIPSSTPERDERGTFRMVAGWCGPIKDRLSRLLLPTGNAGPKHQPQLDRFKAQQSLEGEAVLLLDDTWTTGASAHSAAYALRTAGASAVALVAVGRHVDPNWAVGGKTCAEIVYGLPRFDWARCCVHS